MYRLVSVIKVKIFIFSLPDKLLVLQECGGLFVYFYESGNVFHEKVVRDLEDLEDDMGGLGDDSDPNVLDFVKIGEPGIDDDYGLEDLPALLYFAQVSTEIIQCISNVLTFHFKSYMLMSGAVTH